jgi:hypothetical protein
MLLATSTSSESDRRTVRRGGGPQSFAGWLVWGRNNQELWGKVVATIVVDDRGKQL